MLTNFNTPITQNYSPISSKGGKKHRHRKRSISSIFEVIRIMKLMRKKKLENIRKQINLEQDEIINFVLLTF